MNNVLSDANILLHRKIELDNSPFVIRRRGDLLHICIGSIGCRFQTSGSCVMCNYGKSNPICKADINRLFSIVKEQENSTSSILIGTYGSLFDEREMPLEILDLILEHLNTINIDIIVFETHYLTVNKEILEKIKKTLIGKDVAIELGLESSNKTTLEQCLNKSIDLSVFLQKVNLIHLYKMSVTANVFLGAPFLTIKEQIEDTLKTIIWAFENSVDNVVIFPANIRKNTLIEFLYNNNRFQQLSYWSLFEVLRHIPQSYQTKVFLSWFGDWNDEKIVIGSAHKYDNALIELFSRYLNLNDNLRRNKCLNSFLDNAEIAINYADFIKQMTEEDLLNCEKGLQIRIREQHMWISKNIRNIEG